LTKEWIKQRRNDQFYKRARSEGYRSRAAYKLKEIDNRLTLIKQGYRVLDVGASPGGWSQVALEKAGDRGIVVAVDLVGMTPIPGVTFIHGDITDKATVEEVLGASPEYDVVVSDASPKLSGNKVFDRGRDYALCHAIMTLALQVLRPGGTAVIKVFQGDELIELRTEFSVHFRSVDTLKPKSSIGRSEEVFLAFRGRRKETQANPEISSGSE
jgi:23S rRNA (uridine2552-2'-O)-methyltransferase